jgi:hypothetical protein
VSFHCPKYVCDNNGLRDTTNIISYYSQVKSYIMLSIKIVIQGCFNDFIDSIKFCQSSIRNYMLDIFAIALRK